MEREARKRTPRIQAEPHRLKIDSKMGAERRRTVRLIERSVSRREQKGAAGLSIVGYSTVISFVLYYTVLSEEKRLLNYTIFYY